MPFSHRLRSFGSLTRCRGYVGLQSRRVGRECLRPCSGCGRGNCRDAVETRVPGFGGEVEVWCFVDLFFVCVCMRERRGEVLLLRLASTCFVNAVLWVSDVHTEEIPGARSLCSVLAADWIGLDWAGRDWTGADQCQHSSLALRCKEGHRLIPN